VNQAFPGWLRWVRACCGGGHFCACGLATRVADGGSALRAAAREPLDGRVGRALRAQPRHTNLCLFRCRV
jgi:hypothetical protein